MMSLPLALLTVFIADEHHKAKMTHNYLAQVKNRCEAEQKSSTHLH
jgi:hypothetical protein